MPQSPDIGQISDGGISDFWISGQSLIKKIDSIPELGLVTKLDRRNKTMSKKIDNDVMLKNCDIILIFSIYGQFGAIRKPDSRHRVCKGYVVISSNLLFYKNWKQLKIPNTALTLLLWVKVLFLLKNTDFLQNNADISKIKGALVLKVVLSETAYGCVLTCQLSSF